MSSDSVEDRKEKIFPLGHLWKPPLAEDLTSPRDGRALCTHSAAAEAWDVAMRHSDAKSRRVSGALRQRALPIMHTATAVENRFPKVPFRRYSSPPTVNVTLLI